ncbi:MULTISPECIES: hypothetical protein [Streptomyces]|jgi:hypothetical protein|uniref:hypothetical protein n=1 Tax=Streptomyces TaxID=1883 RepID=UPI00076C6DA3|nr:hypothetical protein [Streptomyces griseorubiginosus]KUM78778.1 hypothetical protein AQI84_07140 [Streptomyces griseorubiginosus]
MFRGGAVRTALAALTAVLFALQFFAPTEGFATAHTVRHVEAKAPAGSQPTGSTLRIEAATKRHCNPAGDPTGPLRARDRHRAVDFAPQGPDRAALTQESATTPGHHPVPSGFPLSRPSTAHAPAALQVFRC